MSDLHAKTHLKEASISAVVIRADGSTEDLGVISYTHRNPLRRAWWRITGRTTWRQSS